jgi:hypothetical protein
MSLIEKREVQQLLRQDHAPAQTRIPPLSAPE